MGKAMLQMLCNDIFNMFTGGWCHILYNFMLFNKKCKQTTGLCSVCEFKTNGELWKELSFVLYELKLDQLLV